jgi:hypothetical protein
VISNVLNVSFRCMKCLLLFECSNRGQMPRLNRRNLLHQKVESKFVLQIISTMNLLSVNDSYFSYSDFSIFPDTIRIK